MGRARGRRRPRSSSAAAREKVRARIAVGSSLLVVDQPLDPVGQDPGLAAAGPAGEQQGPGRVRDGGALGRVQGRERLVEGPDHRAALW